MVRVLAAIPFPAARRQASIDAFRLVATAVRILIVEDNAAVRQLIGSILAPVAGEIIECADGIDALATYEACRPDVVLMDIALPQVDGLAATEAITIGHPGALVVMVTSHDDPALRKAAFRAGACAYLVKDRLTDLPGLLRRISGCATP